MNRAERTTHPNIAAAIEADRIWFGAHPRRAHRIRRALPRELPGIPTAPAGYWIIIRELGPGIRARVFMITESEPPDDELIAQALFDLIIEHGAAGNSLIPTAAIYKRAAAMARGGRA